MHTGVYAMMDTRGQCEETEEPLRDAKSEVIATTWRWIQNKVDFFLQTV